MKKIWSRLMVFLSSLCTCLLLTGCTQALSPKLSIPTAIAALSVDIAKAGSLPTSGTSDWSAEQLSEFQQMVFRTQCQQGRADPITVVMLGDVTLQMQGGFTESGSFSIPASNPMNSSLGMSSGKSTSQTLSLPVAVVSLSILPEVIFSRRMEYILKGVTNGAAITADIEAMRTQAVRDEQELRRITQALMKSWTPIQCGTFTSPTVLMGVHR